MSIQQKTQISEIKDTIVMLRQLSADEKIRMEAYYREKRLHDEASALGSAKREGEAIGRVKGRAEGEAIGEARGRAEGEAIGEARGRAEAYSKLAEKMRKSGFTEEQIKALLGSDNS